MAEADLITKVALKDEASGPMKDFAKSVKNLAKDFEETAPKVNSATGGILRFATGIAVGNIATMALRKVVLGLTGELKSSLDSFNEYQSAMIGLSSVAAAFGQNQIEAKDAAMSLAQDGLMSVTDAGDGLKNLLATGFGLDQAINLMVGFKDAAAFNRQGTLEFGQAIVGATQGLKNQNSIMVDNVGVTKNLSVIMKEAGLSVDDLGKITSDASVRQKLYNALLRETAVFAGDAALASDTLQGAQSALNTSVNMLRKDIGSALAPAVLFLTSSATDATNSFRAGLQPALEKSAKGAVLGVAAVKGLALAFKTVLATAAEVARTAIENVAMSMVNLWEIKDKVLHEGDLKGAWQQLKNTGKAVVDNTKDGIDEITRMVEKASADFGQLQDDVGTSLFRIEQTHLEGYQAVAKEAIENISTTMSDAAKKLADQIADEMRRFAKAIRDQERSYEESMRDAVVSHKERVKTIKEQIEDEKKSFAEALETIKNNQKDELTQFKIAIEERLTSLKRQLDTELARGKNSNLEKVKNLEDMLRREKSSLEEQLKLKEELQTEEAQKAREDYEEALSELQKDLNEEMDLQVKFAEEFAKFADAQVEDDITRLKRKFAEERALMLQDHQERLNDIKNQAQAESDARSGNTQSTKKDPQSKNDLLDMGYGGYAGWQDAEALADYKSGHGAGKYTGARFEKGGIVTKPTIGLVGESGPEAIVPLNNSNRAKRIMDSAGLTNEKSVNINAPITVVNSELDMQILIERMAFEMNKQGLI